MLGIVNQQRIRRHLRADGEDIGHQGRFNPVLALGQRHLSGLSRGLGHHVGQASKSGFQHCRRVETRRGAARLDPHQRAEGVAARQESHAIRINPQLAPFLQPGQHRLALNHVDAHAGRQAKPHRDG